MALPGLHTRPGMCARLKGKNALQEGDDTLKGAAGQSTTLQDFPAALFFNTGCQIP